MALQFTAVLRWHYSPLRSFDGTTVHCGPSMALQCTVVLRWHYSALQSFDGTTVHCSPSMALQSTAVLRLHNGLLHSALFFDLPFQFLILYLLISVCTQLHHLFLGRPVSRLLCGVG